MRSERWGGAERTLLLHLHPRRRVIMAMAASRLLWASRAASYLKISTFPRAFSTGTSPLHSPPSLHVFTVRACISCAVPRVPRDHGSLVLERRDLVLYDPLRLDLGRFSGDLGSGYVCTSEFVREMRAWGCKRWLF